MKKTLVTVIIAALVTMVPATPSLADLPDAYTSNTPDDLYTIDVDSLTEDELRTAYSTLRDTYAACFQALIDEHAKHTGDGEDSAPETPVDSSLWMVKYFVDEFQQPTDKAYISNSEWLEGTFSNTATTNSYLRASLLIEEDSFGIKLLEYGDNVVKGYQSSGQDYTVIALVDGEKTHGNGTLYKGSSVIWLRSEDAEVFTTLLKTGKEMQLYLKEIDYADTYLFTIPASSGFAEMYQTTFG